ncbi:Photosystem I iron-sulfur center [Candidatus Izimaplasma bacterium HR1]|jgi:ferredoxin|uniref:4Fe-4S dicluster domain-containing protein n=1 Tax=Candidatus Izimoplasma sp. HR1 TaxID=1541959 RepID=UPI0004F8BBF6|nr:Photosystem I iron-sulfur center [Candidatus Izimaplasma bacterium HR1]
MGHNTSRSGYEKLVDRLNKFPQGVPPSDTLYEILKLLFSEEEAKLVSLLPIKPFTTKTAAKAWKKSEAEASVVLNELASRALLVDVERDGNQTFSLPPPMAGFFEFSMMRIGGNFDQKLLGELFYQYMNIEDEFVTDLLTLPTPIGRAYVHEETIEDHMIHVLDYERATKVIKTATHIGIGTCYCRHKKEHVGEACDAPMEICMTFNQTAASLIKYGYARQVEEEECLDLLELAKKHNLVQFGDNVQNEVAFICNCCSCCCEALVGARKVGPYQAINSSNFICNIIDDNCKGCQKCVDVCPVEALSMVSRNLPNSKKMLAQLVEENCIGCGVCARVCGSDAIKMNPRDQKVFTPVNMAHRVVLEAIETGKLQNLIFDNQAHFRHRALASILGAILKLPVIKQTLASKQVKSKYILKLIQNKNSKIVNSHILKD